MSQSVLTAAAEVLCERRAVRRGEVRCEERRGKMRCEEWRGKMRRRAARRDATTSGATRCCGDDGSGEDEIVSVNQGKP